jgi:hypothetical protein
VRILNPLMVIYSPPTAKPSWLQQNLHFLKPSRAN